MNQVLRRTYRNISILSNKRFLGLCFAFFILCDKLTTLTLTYAYGNPYLRWVDVSIDSNLSDRVLIINEWLIQNDICLIFNRKYYFIIKISSKFKIIPFPKAPNMIHLNKFFVLFTIWSPNLFKIIYIFWFYFKSIS